MNNELDFSPTTSYIQLDLFPATVYKVPETVEDKEIVAKEARIIVTNDYIYVILIGTEGTYFVVREELVEIYMVPKLGYQVYGAQNEYYIERDGNCGCGTRLRGMRFLPGVGHTGQPVSTK